ncbi:MAG: protein-export chaperone SecB [Burkholderiales bacterium]|nr:protein-export chaperone SecB [Burkholderiales bacterium]
MTDQQQTVFSIEKVYVKDASLELPNAPRVFLEAQTPQVEIQLSSNAEKVSDTLYDVVVTVTATAKQADKTYFLVEVAQAGIFQIHGVPEPDLQPILGIACPNILFPYAREAVADLVGRAGFPPIHLAPVNFEAIYMQRLQQEQAQPSQLPLQTAN